VSRSWHRPAAWSWLLLAAGVAAFLALGRWQLQRGAEKEQLLAAFAAAERATPRPFATLGATLSPADYPRVMVQGRFLVGRGYLLDEQPHAGQFGVHAIAVFAPQGDPRRLLVDRGWLPWSHAPGTQPAVPPLPSGEVTLSGMYAPPPGGGLRIGGDALPQQTAWPKLTLRLDLGEVANDLGQSLHPRLLLQDPDPSSGFVREWKPEVMPPERHRGYALQWFTFALAALVIFVLLHWRKAPTDTP
jgi:cytochrome oxidase assembly protein ShyY1